MKKYDFWSSEIRLKGVDKRKIEAVIKKYLKKGVAVEVIC